MSFTVLNIFIILFAVIAVMYGLLILFFTISWNRIPSHLTRRISKKTKISIVIPVRNESDHIENCLKSLCNQDYPKNLMEIIICDDSSTDHTVALVNEFIRKHRDYNIKLIELSQKKLIYKKQAIAEAVAIAAGELIAVTDGDCSMGEKWLSEIVMLYENKKFAFIAGPVVFYDTSKIFERIQSLEFLSLVATGLGSVAGNFPVMCNGANLAFTRKAFIEVDGYKGNTGIVSGDDIFLLQKIKTKYPDKIGVIKSENAIVYTHAQKDLKSFISQRLRWVSKSHGYRSLPTVITSLTVYLMNFILLISGILSSFSTEMFFIFLVLFSFKIIIDWPVLISISAFAKRTKLLIYAIPLQIIYIVYISLIGLAGNVVKVNWKERKIN